MRQQLTILLFTALAACATDDGFVDDRPDFTDEKADDPNSWCHGNLAANDGVELSLDYQVQDRRNDRLDTNFVASPLWINVRRGDFHAGQRARAVLVPQSWDNECGAFCRDNFAQQGAVAQVDLVWEHGRFTGELAAQTIQAHFANDNAGGTSTLFELAVVVDGTWYKGTNGKNLRFIPTDSPGFCARGTTF